MNQEQIMRIHLIEKETDNLNEQIRFIDQNIDELRELTESLEVIEEREGEILVNIGKKVYLPVEIKTKKLIVNVGKNNLVKKNIIETRLIINEQIDSLNESKFTIMNKLEELQKETEELIKKLEKNQ